MTDDLREMAFHTLMRNLDNMIEVIEQAGFTKEELKQVLSHLLDVEFTIIGRKVLDELAQDDSPAPSPDEGSTQ